MSKRLFYGEYRGRPKLQPLVREISWSKNLVILSRCKDGLGREFYLRATARFEGVRHESRNR